MPHADAATLTVPVVLTQESALAGKRSEWLSALKQCENNQWPELRRIVDTNGYYSYGPLMFQMGTWLTHGKTLGATKENIYDENLQELVAIRMLDHGGAGHWYTCNAKITKTLGTWPI